MYDPRFPPVAPDELADLTYSVDVLSPAEEVSDLSSGSPPVQGYCGKQRAPGSAFTGFGRYKYSGAADHGGITKAGIEPGEPYRLFRFQVERFQ